MTMHGDAVISARAARIAVFGLWLLMAAALIAVNWHAIVAMDLRDSDDAVRLVEVRDWMAGQGWFDNVQHRINPPHSAPMHWSRLVDIPIAALIWLAQAVLPTAQGEIVAIVALPLLLLLALAYTVFGLTYRVTRDRFVSLVATCLLAMSMGVFIQYLPMRIDHHNWQILLDSLACLLLLGRPGQRTIAAAGAGAIMALSLVIALEGMPIAIGIGGVLVLRYLSERGAAGPVIAYLATLTTVAALLAVATLGPAGASVMWCDTLSPAYLVPLAGAAIVLPFAVLLLGPYGLAGRLGSLALAGVVASALFLAFSRSCEAGPFAALDPVVYRIWYRSVGEGMPVWTQAPDLQILVPVQTVLGLVGAALALRHAPVDRRWMWRDLLILQIVAGIVSMFVMRAMGLAHVLALPGAAWLVVAAFRAATGLRTPVARVLSAPACLLLTPIGAELLAMAMVPEAQAAATRTSAATVPIRCLSARSMRAADALPASEIFTPLDVGSFMLVYTHHSVVGTGHHRNSAGMRNVIAAFMSTPDRARSIITATPAHYLAYCPEENETAKYVALNKQSLTAALQKGQVPSWLEPVKLPQKTGLRVYRIAR